MKILKVELERVFALHLEAAMRAGAAALEGEPTETPDVKAVRAEALRLGAAAIKAAVVEAARR